MNKDTFKNPYYLVTAILFVVAFLSFLLFTVIRYEKVIEKDMFKNATSDVLQITEHKALFIKEILKDSRSYIDDIKKDEKLREELERNIKNLITDNIKYAYILYKDKNNVFRFLVDASPESEKSLLDQKFDVSSPEWFELYTKKEPIIIKHAFLQKLSISYLVPILHGEKVELVLAIDFSIKKIQEISRILAMMKMGIALILILMSVSLGALIFQLFRYRAIKKSSYTDRLTNVFNRNYLQDIESKINLNEYILGVLDIDQFKKINDTYGHNVGDTILKEVGSILLNTIRVDEDIVIRYGGEEFVILIKRKSEDSEISYHVIERIFNNIRNHKMFINTEDYIQITVSIGINKNPGKYKNFSEAFKSADSALYEAKNSGRDKIKISEDYLGIEDSSADNHST